MALLTSSFAEPPALSHSYGVPQISTGYSYEPTVSHSVATDYVEQHVGHQTSEGLHLDADLLHKIEHVLVQHENSGSKIVSVPSSGYGVPQSSYGLPSHWSHSARVVGIDFDHLRQSIPVAQYLGQERYAHGYNYNSGHSSNYNSGYSTGSSGWNVASRPSYVHSIPQYVSSSPAWSLAAPKPSAGWTVARPSIKYGVPRW